MALKDKLMTLEDFKAVRDVDVASNQAQFTEIKADLGAEDIASISQPFTVIANSKVASRTGEISESDSYSRSDFTDLKSCESITLGSVNDVDFINYVFYDKNKVYISGATGTNDQIKGTHDCPSGAKYIIFTTKKDSIGNATLTLNNAKSVVGEISDKINTKVGTKEVFSTPFVQESVLLQNVIGVTKYPNNLVDYDRCENNKYIGHKSGNTLDGDTYFCTGFIPVTAGETYKANHGRNYAWYNSSKVYIDGATGTDIQVGITAPEGASYIRFTINKSHDGISNPLDLYFANIADYSSSVVIPGLAVENIAAKPWCYGKTINWIGDSIVDGQDFDEVVCSALGLTKLTTDGVDGGINGSTIALKSDGTDGRNALCLRYSDMPNNADIIAVSCGTNDFQYAWCPIGDIESTSNSTFYGALKTLCEGLINKYPQKLIFFTTPIKRAQAFGGGNGGEYTADEVMTTPFSKNKYGKTLGDYADIIKEVCGYYSIPVLDMYRESLLNPHLTPQQNLFDSELTHPNKTGQKIMARRVAGWITQLGYLIE